MTVVNLRRWFRDPLFLLALAAGLIAFVVQSGELGSADTTHRLQTAHAWWTGQPEVFPNEFPEFGVHGRGGKLQSWYSMGQSLILLPPDVVGAYVARLPIFADYDDTDPSVRDIIVSYTINILLAVLTALVCFRFLRQLNFSVTQSVLGVLALLVATTHLHYTQNMMENNYIFLLSITGFCFQYEWLRTDSRRALSIGSAAFGLNLLTRLPTGLDLLAGALFLLLVLMVRRYSGPSPLAARENIRGDCFAGVPVLRIDRSPLPVPPLRVFLQYLHHRHRSRNQDAQSFAPSQLSFRDPLARGLFRGALHPREVDFSLRSFDSPHDPSVHRCLEAIHVPP